MNGKSLCLFLTEVLSKGANNPLPYHRQTKHLSLPHSRQATHLSPTQKQVTCSPFSRPYRKFTRLSTHCLVGRLAVIPPRSVGRFPPPRRQSY
jgi:hypothetical protein